jgi:hypothetical protein
MNDSQYILLNELSNLYQNADLFNKMFLWSEKKNKIRKEEEGEMGGNKTIKLKELWN